MASTPRHRAAAGVAALCLVAGGLVALRRLPEQATRALVLGHADPAVHTLWTTHFVHASRLHATTNALGLLVAALPGLAVAHRHDRVQQYWTAVVGVGVIVPFPLSVTTLLWYRHLTSVRVSSSLGASGLVGGLAGVTLVIATA
ncbi:MAG: rhomboid family, partial [halophilic archaeon J07HB67]